MAHISDPRARCGVNTSHECEIQIHMSGFEAAKLAHWLRESKTMAFDLDEHFPAEIMDLLVNLESSI